MDFVAKTLYGIEPVLAEELRELGAHRIKPVNRAVLFSGDKETMYRVNYCAGTAMSVMMVIESFSIGSKDELYRKALLVDWTQFMDADSTFSVVPVVNSPLFTHTAYPGLVIKDAIADHFRNRTGKRPSVSTSDPQITINLHISGNRADLSIDSSGAPLFKRGYRTGQPPAPLNEVLAAGIIRLSGWDASVPLSDPMCGSGTIPVEAALYACRIPPGKFRKQFGFYKWKDFDEELFNKVRRGCDAMIRKSPVKITGSDITEQAVRQSQINVKNAGLSEEILIERSDFRDIKPVGQGGFLVFNPPYGERLKPDDLKDLYRNIGTILKHYYSGYKAYIIIPGKEMLAEIGLKPREKYTIFNGSLECIVAGFELYAGTRKHGKEQKSS